MRKDDSDPIFEIKELSGTIAPVCGRALAARRRVRRAWPASRNSSPSQGQGTVEGHPDVLNLFGANAEPQQRGCDVHARVASDEERGRLWPKLSAVNPGYDFFQELVKGRKIPVVILEHREGPSA
jgi:F420H(2)-dependent quinone reductase